MSDSARSRVWATSVRPCVSRILRARCISSSVRSTVGSENDDEPKGAPRPARRMRRGVCVLVVVLDEESLFGCRVVERWERGRFVTLVFYEARVQFRVSSSVSKLILESDKRLRSRASPHAFVLTCLVETWSLANHPSSPAQRCGRGRVSSACERMEWLRTRSQGQGLMVQMHLLTKLCTLSA